MDNAITRNFFTNFLEILGIFKNYTIKNRYHQVLQAIESNRPNFLKDLIQNMTVDCIDEILSIGEMNSKFQELYPLLATAIKSKNPNVAQILITFGSNPNMLFNQRDSMLHLAIRRCDLDMVKILVSNGAEINHQNESGLSALHYASLKNEPHILEFLIESGANLNLKDKSGCSAILYASYKGCIERDFSLFNILIDAGADCSEIESPNDIFIPITTFRRRDRSIGSYEALDFTSTPTRNSEYRVLDEPPEYDSLAYLYPSNYLSMTNASLLGDNLEPPEYTQL